QGGGRRSNEDAALLSVTYSQD
ncbi:MAG: hypothetical protein QOG49_1681, partial [Frankiaceae bacterium]|nr:hypothetical protein [Frankiaceae bacterium]